MRSIFAPHNPLPSQFRAKKHSESEKQDIVYTFDCLDVRAPSKSAVMPRRRNVRDKSAEHDADMKVGSWEAFIKNTKPEAVISPDTDDDSTTASTRHGATSGSSSFERKEGTLTPTESWASESSNKGTSPCTSPPPELPGSIDVAAENTSDVAAVPGFTVKRTFRYSTIEDCVNDKVEFKRILRQLGQNAEFKYRNIRNMFIAADTDGSGKLTVEETVELFSNFGLESALAHKFFNFIDKDGSGEIDWREFMAAFGPVFNEKRSTSARDRRCVPQRYNTWRPVPGPIAGMMRMFLA